MSSVTNDISVKEWMGIGALIGYMSGALVGTLAVGLPLTLTGHEALSCLLGGGFGGAACGAFLGGTTSFVVASVIAQVREHQDTKNLPPNDPNITDEKL